MTSPAGARDAGRTFLVRALLFLPAVAGLAAAFLPPRPAAAQESDSVPVQITVMLDDISPQEGMRTALRRAHLAGVRAQCGYADSTLDWARRPEQVLDFLGLVSRAQVRDVKVLTWEVIVQQKTLQTPPRIGYKVKMDVRVDCDGWKEDRAHPRPRLRCALNALQYKPGDELSITVTPANACFLQVLHFAPSDSVHLLYPNAMQPARLVAAGETVEIPAAVGRRTGLARATVEPAAGESSGRGLLWIVATPAALPLPDPTPLGGGLVYVGTTSEAIARIAEWLIYMPAGQRVMDVLQYDVHADGPAPAVPSSTKR